MKRRDPVGARVSRLGSIALVLFWLGACSAEPATADGGCVMPTAAALETPSAQLVLALDPNPVSPGGRATLSARGDSLTRGLVGVAALFECWDGEEWIITHTLFRGINGQPSTVEGAVPMILLGVGLPNAYPIQIPEVAPGIYRIRDSAN